MAWTLNTSSYTLTHTGTVRDVYLPTWKLYPSFRISLQAAKRQDCPRAIVLAHPDGRTGWEIGIDPSDVTKAVIRRVIYGAASAAVASVSHGVAADKPLTVEIDRLGDVLTVRVIATGYTTTSVSHTNTTEPTFNKHSAWGIVSTENGAVILSAVLKELRAENVELTEALVVVAGGNVYTSTDGETVSLMAASVFGASSDVSLTEQDGLVYGVDGAKVKEIDIVARQARDLGPAGGGNWDITINGAPPGATVATGNERVPGTTTARVNESHGARLVFGGMDTEPTLLYESAIGDPQMFYTAELAQGRAFVLGDDRQQGLVHPVLALHSADQNTMIVGCTRSIYALIGDPADQGLQRQAMCIDAGVSGATSIITGTGGVTVDEQATPFVLAHSPDAGLLKGYVGGSMTSLSVPVLTKYIQFPRTDRTAYTVSMVRDTARHGLLLLITKDSGSNTHLWYDERIGRYSAGQGGFFPETYPINPTCAVNWRGDVVMGGRDAFVYTFSDTTDDDLGTTPIESNMLAIVNLEDVSGDTILKWCRIELADTSDPVTMKVYGAATVEGLFGTNRRLLRQRTISPGASPDISPLRAPALGFELSSNTLGKRWRLEAIDFTATTGPFLRRGVWTTPPVPPTPCIPPVGGSSSGGGGSDVFGSGPGAAYPSGGAGIGVSGTSGFAPAPSGGFGGVGSGFGSGGVA